MNLNYLLRNHISMDLCLHCNSREKSMTPVIFHRKQVQQVLCWMLKGEKREEITGYHRGVWRTSPKCFSLSPIPTSKKAMKLPVTLPVPGRMGWLGTQAQDTAAVWVLLLGLLVSLKLDEEREVGEEREWLLHHCVYF